MEYEVTTPYMPQHNGLAERRNKLLLIYVCLKGKDCPTVFGGKQ